MRNMYVYFAPVAFLERKKPEVSGLSLCKDCWKANKQTIMLFVQKAAAFDDGNSFQLLVWKSFLDEQVLP